MKRKISISLIVNFKKKNSIDLIKKIISKFFESDYEVYVSFKLAEIIQDSRCIAVDSKELQKHSNTFVVAGGDGTFIGVAREYSKFGVNILPVNIGYLGFLSEISADNLLNEIDKINLKNAPVEQRMMLETEFNGFTNLAVNEIVISQNSLSRLICLEISLNGRFFTAIRSDGIIISTPTGSTGHSLSAGGPIVNPVIDCIILTPLCAHSLAIRPIILSKSDMISARVSSINETVV
nr:NAD(+)/NADH kinase [bacterium]